MSDIDVLKDMFKDSAIVKLDDSYKKKKVKLTEPQCPQSELTINGIPEDSIVIKSDALKLTETIFKGTKGEGKRGDYIIISETNKQKVIIYIELKNTTDSEKEIIQQLKGSYCFSHYIQKIGNEFWEEKEFLSRYNHRYVSFTHTNIAKKTTRIDSIKGCNDKPNRMYKFSGAKTIQFNQLIGAN